MPTTETYWDYNGVSLQEVCWNIETLGGDRDSVPMKRGEDMQVAYRPGRLWQEKIPDSRTISLAMWLIGSDKNGSAAYGKQDQFNVNRRTLKALFYDHYGRQFPLTRRWYENGVLLSATAQAEQVGDLKLAKAGPWAGAFVADFFLADPYFYGPAVTNTLAVGVGQTVANAGDVPCLAYGMSLKFNGALTNPKVTRTSGNVWVQLGGSVAGGDYVILDQFEWTAVRNSDSANLVGAVTHSGAKPWMVLDPGNNTLTLTASAGTGTVDVIRKPAYL